MKKLASIGVIGLLAVLLLSFTVTPALAGGKGKGSGGNTGTTTSATLSAAPNPAAPSSSVWVSGTGYSYTTWVEVRVLDSNGQVVAAYAGVVWFDGHIGFSMPVPASPGTYTLKSYQTLGRDKTATFMAQTTLLVQ